MVEGKGRREGMKEGRSEGKNEGTREEGSERSLRRNGVEERRKEGTVGERPPFPGYLHRTRAHLFPRESNLAVLASSIFYLAKRQVLVP